MTAMSAASPSWDPLVRLTHWVIAAAVLLNGLILEGGSLIHIWLGYTALALLLLRLVWGFIGPEEARFASFLPSLKTGREHLRDLLAGRYRSYRSHNPLGAFMVYALWGTLVIVAATGVAMESNPFPTESEGHERSVVFGAEHDEDEAGVADERSGEENEALEEVHEILANLLLVLAGLHVVGVSVETRLGGFALLRGMTTGSRTAS